MGMDVWYNIDLDKNFSINICLQEWYVDIRERWKILRTNYTSSMIVLTFHDYRMIHLTLEFW